jgi:hypothetical protein
MLHFKTENGTDDTFGSEGDADIVSGFCCTLLWNIGQLNYRRLNGRKTALTWEVFYSACK